MRRNWVMGLLAVLVSAGALAGDGIPMGNAVFYPSVEAVYTHTDNLYLVDASMTPPGKVSDSFWEIRPALGFEFPFKQSYLRFDLVYQYKDYQTFQLSEHNTYEGKLEGNFKFTNGMQLKVDAEFLQGVQETLKFDPGYERYFGNTPFKQANVNLGLVFPLGHIDTLEVYGLYNHVRFDNTSVNEPGPPFYNYTTSGGGLTWRHNYNPQSDWLVDARYQVNTPDQTDANLKLDTADVSNKKSEDWRGMLGWEGAMTQGISGYAKAGYERMTYPDNGYGDFGGLAVDMGLNFKPSEFVSVNLEVTRSPYQSTYNVNNYYTATAGDLQVHQEVSRYLFWTAGYRYQENSYPDAVVADVYGTGTPTSIESQLTAGQFRTDKIGRLFGEVGFHFSRQLSIRANYQYEDRNSNISYFYLGLDRKPYSYTENRFMVQAQFGW